MTRATASASTIVLTMAAIAGARRRLFALAKIAFGAT